MPREFATTISPDAFWGRTIPEPNTGCWLWLGTVNKDGYGQTGGVRGTVAAHRVAWQLARGPIPPGAGVHGTCVLHRCDNPPCVNPAHLFLGSNRDNVRDRARKGRSVVPHPIGEANHAAKLTVGDVLRLRGLRDSGGKLSELSRDFGISLSTTWNIANRKTWRHVEEAS